MKNLHHVIRDECALAQAYAADGAFYQAAAVLRRLATRIEAHVIEADGPLAARALRPVADGIPDGITVVGGRPHMMDAKGNLCPLDLIKPADKLEDQTVRKIVGYAEQLSGQISRFKAHTFEDLGTFDAILAEDYGTKKGGARGNKTYATFDGLQKVQVQVADHIDFGPQLQIAKGLIDECLVEWSEGSRPEIQAIVTRAFNTDKEGQINRAEIFMLLRLDIADDRWQRAMQAIRDAMRVVGSKTYVRCYSRATFDGAWEPITIDLAKA